MSPNASYHILLCIFTHCPAAAEAVKLFPRSFFFKLQNASKAPLQNSKPPSRWSVPLPSRLADSHLLDMTLLDRTLDVDWSTLGGRLFCIILVAYATRRYVEAKRSPVRLFIHDAWLSSDSILQLNSIPTIGYSGVLTSYLTALKWITHGNELVQEGYDRVNNYPLVLDENTNLMPKNSILLVNSKSPMWPDGWLFSQADSSSTNFVKLRMKFCHFKKLWMM